MRLIRVFPRRARATPEDDLAVCRAPDDHPFSKFFPVKFPSENQAKNGKNPVRKSKSICPKIKRAVLQSVRPAARRG
jgi:hypothetical protein